MKSSGVYLINIFPLTATEHAEVIANGQRKYFSIINDFYQLY